MINTMLLLPLMKQIGYIYSKVGNIYIALNNGCYKIHFNKVLL
jgi:hypothetical protein